MVPQLANTDGDSLWILYGFAAASAAAAFRFARMSHRDLTEWVHIR